MLESAAARFEASRGPRQAIDQAVSKFEVGYWGRVSQLGQRLVTEAVAPIVDFAFPVPAHGASTLNIRPHLRRCLDAKCTVRAQAVAE
jgi:hypothetical protein